jgi:uncharacterized protein (DUF488 family)
VADEPDALTIFTVGHSNRTLEQLVAILDRAGVRAVADVRRVPQSRYNPQFRRGAFGPALAAHEIAYAWIEELGGRREPSPDTPHVALEGPYAGFAEHLRTEEFARGIERLYALAADTPTAVLCAEGRPDQCHRRILADWLVSRGHRVIHVIDATRALDHALSAEARLDGDHLVYDRGAQRSLL